MAEVNRISKEALQERMNRVTLINVLEPDYNHLGMIPGSKRIPLSQLAQRSAELDKGKEIVVYCAGYHCDASRKAANLLSDLGFTVSAYEGGLEEWKGAGLPMDTAGQVEAPGQLGAARMVK